MRKDDLLKIRKMYIQLSYILQHKELTSNQKFKIRRAYDLLKEVFLGG